MPKLYQETPVLQKVEKNIDKVVLVAYTFNLEQYLHKRRQKPNQLNLQTMGKKTSAKNVVKDPARASMRKPSVKVQEDVKDAKKSSTLTKKEKAEAERPLVRIVDRPKKKVVHVVVPNGKPTLLAASKESYTKQELSEFKRILKEKLDTARKNYDLLERTSVDKDNHGTDETYRPMKVDEDSGEGASRADALRLLDRQKKFITELENAQQRLNNGTYGVCMRTGRLISPERLRLVPHATLSAEAKKEMPQVQKGTITGVPLNKMSASA